MQLTNNDESRQALVKDFGCDEFEAEIVISLITGEADSQGYVWTVEFLHETDKISLRDYYWLQNQPRVEQALNAINTFLGKECYIRQWPPAGVDRKSPNAMWMVRSGDAAPTILWEAEQNAYFLTADASQWEDHYKVDLREKG